MLLRVIFLMLVSFSVFSEDYGKISYSYGQLNMRGEEERKAVFEDASIFSAGAGTELISRLYLESMISVEFGNEADIYEDDEGVKSFNTLGASIALKYILFNGGSFDTYVSGNYLIWTGGETYDDLAEPSPFDDFETKENLYTGGDFGVEVGFLFNDTFEVGFKIQEYSAVETGFFGLNLGLII